MAAPPPEPSTEAATEPHLPMPRPYRGRLGAAVALNATCVSCHAEEAAAWRGSHHQRAHLNPAFREAFTIEPTAFCRGCHAPEADPRKDPPAAVGQLGVACVTCHVTEEGSVLAATVPGTAPAAPGGADLPATVGMPHAVQRSPEFARTGGCVGCHEFRFPLAPGDEDAHFMQTTVREHQRSPSAGKACAACHMPVVKGRRSHAFAEVRDPEWLRDHLRVTAARVEEDTVRLTLVQTTPGHAFPTGDLFRRLEVGCELRRADGKVVRREVRHLARHFEAVPGKPGRHLDRDDRVESAPKTVDIELSVPPSAPPSDHIAWWVTYQRVATVGAGTDPSQARVESEVKLHAGVLR
ncbi:multiheme c-type cytochrome [Chondromyces apiculatus]|nr:multiheme c-type cytochrome [Chondromyces apiculatus]